jgi:general secretion pathway protein A
VIPARAFAPGCTPQLFLETVAAADVLRRLDEGLGEREPFLLVTGESGTGKTVLAHEAIARWGERVTAAFVAYPALSGVELLEEILRRFGAEPPEGGSRPRFMASLERVLADLVARGRLPMIVVDDAHALTAGLIEELRLLVNAAREAGQPLEVMLLGLPALEAALAEPALGAVRQRISVHARLDPFSPGETRRYVRHRATAAGGDGPALFSRTTCVHLATLSRGVPRQVNALAAEALRLAIAANDSTVRPEHVQAAAALLRGPSPPHAPSALDDADDEAGFDAEAPEPSPAPESPARARIAPAVAKASAQVAPAAQLAREIPAAAAAPITPAELVTGATPAPAPASHDTREWVARFVGSQGPIQIGSRSGSSAAWMAERPDAPVGAAAPAGAKPRRAAAAAPPPARAKRSGAGRKFAVTLLAASLVLAAVLLALRSGTFFHAHATQPAAAKPVAQPSIAPAMTGASPSAPPRVTTVPVTASLAASAPAAESRGPFTVEVGEYADAQQAYTQRDRVEAKTHIHTWVVPAPEGSNAPNRVVLGIYRQRRKAEAAANMLLTSRTLHEATVIPMPAGRDRN